jgi:hypothetical protein
MTKQPCTTCVFLNDSISLPIPTLTNKADPTRRSGFLVTVTTTIAFDWSTYVMAIILDMASMIPQSSIYDFFLFFFLFGVSASYLVCFSRTTQDTYKSEILGMGMYFWADGLYIMDGWARQQCTAGL